MDQRIVIFKKRRPFKHQDTIGLCLNILNECKQTMDHMDKRVMSQSIQNRDFTFKMSSCLAVNLRSNNEFHHLRLKADVKRCIRTFEGNGGQCPSLFILIILQKVAFPSIITSRCYQTAD